MNELDKLLHAELDQFEKEMEEEEQGQNMVGSVSQAELTNTLQVCKNAVESVFGPVLIQDKTTGQELCRAAAMNILLAVIHHVCPRQVNYNVIENIDSTGEEWEE